MIEDAANKDDRIKYWGMLNVKQLFEKYQEADILLNLRVLPQNCGEYLFPSKIIEFLMVGKYTISTDAVHIKEVYGDYFEILSNNTPVDLCSLIDTLSEIPKNILFVKGQKARNFILNTITCDIQ